jgi:uncharacterized repeat protein (TIGR03803 family)
MLGGETGFWMLKPMALARGLPFVPLNEHHLSIFPSKCNSSYSEGVMMHYNVLSRIGASFGSAAIRLTGALIGAVLLSSISGPALAQQGTLTTLYSFTGGADGGEPIGGPVVDAKGTLYGETYAAGLPSCTSKVGLPTNGCGTVYSFSSAGGLKTLVSFSGPNGAFGENTLTLSGSTLYGTTSAGGSSNDGVVFSVHTNGGGFTLLHQFGGADGKDPTGILRLGPGNVLYGVAVNGGASNYGVLFSLSPDGTYKVLHNFIDGADGSYPESLLLSPTGVLVGSTKGGGGEKGYYCPYECGTVFEYSIATGKYSVPYIFNGVSGTGGLVSALGPGATVYGNDGNAPFSLNTATGLVDIGCFACVALYGAYDSGPLLAPGGSLIGVNGDNTTGYGTLYSASNDTIEGLAYFGNNGGNPLGQPVLLPSGIILGTASQDGLCADCGTIWQYTPTLATK